MMRQCEFPVAFDTCPQLAYSDGRLCFYHRKVLDGLLEPVDSYLSTAEISSMMIGRRHDDGRRLDAYVLEERRTGRWGGRRTA